MLTKRSVAPQRGFFPQPAYLVGCFAQDGRPIFSLKTWVTFAGLNPPTLMFVGRNARKKATTLRILEAGVFSASLVIEDLLEAADYCGSVSGLTADKVADTGMAWERGAVLDVPLPSLSPWTYECRVARTLDWGDATIFFGEVENILVDEGIGTAERGTVDIPALKPVIYAPTAYYSLGRRLMEQGQSLKTGR